MLLSRRSNILPGVAIITCTKMNKHICIAIKLHEYDLVYIALNQSFSLIDLSEGESKLYHHRANQYIKNGF